MSTDATMLCRRCGSVLSAVTFTCVRGQYCQSSDTSTTRARLDSDGLLPLTNLPLGPTTAIAEHLALRHPIKVKTGRELYERGFCACGYHESEHRQRKAA